MKRGPKYKGPRCSECPHNPMGVCELTGKEISIAFILQRNQGAPAACPLKKGVKK